MQIRLTDMEASPARLNIQHCNLKQSLFISFSLGYFLTCKLYLQYKNEIQMYKFLHG